MKDNTKFFSIRTKLIVFMISLLILTNSFIGILSFQTAKNELDKSGRIILKNGVKMIFEAIELKQIEVDQGLITLEKAQEDIKIYMLGEKDNEGYRPINRNIDLGENGYFFVMDTNGILLAHPAIEGQDIWEMTDRSGTDFYVVKDVIGKAQNGGDYTYYMWELPRSEIVANKINYAEIDPYWGWVVASSIYMSDFNKGASVILDVVAFSLIAIVIITSYMVYYFSRHISIPIIEISENMKYFIENKKVDHKINIKNRDETGILADSFDYMVKELTKQVSDKEKAQNDLIELNKHLKKLVQERTYELEEKNISLEYSLENSRVIGKELSEALKKLEDTQEQLLESEKMATIGTLVAGIAHNFNTPLGITVTIGSNIDLLFDEISEKYKNKNLSEDVFNEFIVEAKDNIKLLNNNLQKSKKLIDQFKQVAVDLYSSDKIEYDLCSYTKKEIAMIKDYSNNKPISVNVKCDAVTHVGSPIAYSQVISNLLLNSVIHGFRNELAGEIVIDIIEVGNSIDIRYTDNGCGIDPSIAAKIFEPFFSTINDSSNSGLGLYIVYNLIIQKFNGHIEFNSLYESGAEFLISFPKYEK